jgi:uncharacterized protein
VKIADIDILIIPGWTNSGPDHWQTRWQAKLRTARRVEQADWDKPMLGDWVGRIIEEVARASRQVVLVAHSCGVQAVIHTAHKLPPGMVAGAFLVGAPDPDATDIWPMTQGGFAPLPLVPLPFPSVLVASSNDPYCSLARARDFAASWGSTLIEAGEAGHINTASGHGPWPEGLMQFGWFLKKLDVAAVPPTKA